MLVEVRSSTKMTFTQSIVAKKRQASHKGQNYVSYQTVNIVNVGTDMLLEWSFKAV